MADNVAVVSGPPARFQRRGRILALRYRHRPIAAASRTVAVAGLAAVLAGCATANVSGVVSSNNASPRPTEILVRVRTAPHPNEPNSALTADVGDRLRDALIKQLTKFGLAAEAYAPGAARSDAATLDVALTEADGGNAAKRFLIGFGVGQAKLQATIELEPGGDSPRQPMTEFTVASNSGYKPGLVMPAVVSAVTGDPIHLAIGGGLKTVTSLRGDGVSSLVDETTISVVRQLKRYYERSGWTWQAHG